MAGPDYLGQQGFGSLRRAASLKSCMLMVNRGFLERVRLFDESLPDDPKMLEYVEHSQRMVDLIESGRVHFDPANDLRPDAVLEGKPGVSSAWFFAGADADVSSPAALRAQLAVGAEYHRGYVVFEVPTETAGPDGLRASRPTALDLTVSPEGRPNPNNEEAFGRTQPTRAGQPSIREVVMAPVPLSKTTIHTYMVGN